MENSANLDIYSLKDVCNNLRKQIRAIGIDGSDHCCENMPGGGGGRKRGVCMCVYMHVCVKVNGVLYVLSNFIGSKRGSLESMQSTVGMNAF